MKLKYLNTGFFGVLVLFFVLVVVITYDPHLQTTNPILQFFIDAHLYLMLGMVLLTGAFGYYLSRTLTIAITDKEETNQGIIHLLLQQLTGDERTIVRHLFQGKSTQANLAELPNMNRLKVHRAVLKLKSKGLIELRKRGKTKEISLVETLAPKP